MKLKDGVVITSVNNTYVLVDTSSNDKRFNGIIKLNDTGKAMCDFLNEELSFEELVNKMLEKYDVEKDILEKDINNTLEKLKEKNIVID